MNKEMQKLLKAINDKKNEVKSLVNDGKLDKAKAAKEELKELQEKFDLLFDLDEEEHEETRWRREQQRPSGQKQTRKTS